MCCRRESNWATQLRSCGARKYRATACHKHSIPNGIADRSGDYFAAASLGDFKCLSKKSDPA